MISKATNSNCREMYSIGRRSFVKDGGAFSTDGNPPIVRKCWSGVLGQMVARSRVLEFKPYTTAGNRARIAGNPVHGLMEYALIIDELGFPLDGNDDWASLFYTLIAKRHEKLSTVITTNRSIKDWPHYLGGDVQCTKASIDRFMQYAIPIKFEGESYRMRKMRQRIATGHGHEVELVRDITL